MLPRSLKVLKTNLVHSTKSFIEAYETDPNHFEDLESLYIGYGTSVTDCAGFKSPLPRNLRCLSIKDHLTLDQLPLNLLPPTLVKFYFAQEYQSISKGVSGKLPSSLTDFGLDVSFGRFSGFKHWVPLLPESLLILEAPFSGSHPGINRELSSQWSCLPRGLTSLTAHNAEFSGEVSELKGLPPRLSKLILWTSSNFDSRMIQALPRSLTYLHISSVISLTKPLAESLPRSLTEISMPYDYSSLGSLPCAPREFSNIESDAIPSPSKIVMPYKTLNSMVLTSLCSFSVNSFLTDLNQLNELTLLNVDYTIELMRCLPRSLRHLTLNTKSPVDEHTVEAGALDLLPPNLISFNFYTSDPLLPKQFPRPKKMPRGLQALQLLGGSATSIPALPFENFPPALTSLTMNVTNPPSAMEMQTLVKACPVLSTIQLYVDRLKSDKSLQFMKHLPKSLRILRVHVTHSLIKLNQTHLTRLPNLRQLQFSGCSLEGSCPEILPKSLQEFFFNYNSPEWFLPDLIKLYSN